MDFRNTAKKNNIEYCLCFLLGSLLLCFLCFYNLGEEPLYSWDEARHGVSAYEMIKNNNYIVTTYNGEIDYWNLKPPLSEWVIALNYKIFGYNAFALRFYSAFSMVLSGILASLFVKRKLGRLCSIYTLVTFSALEPMFKYHCARTGDADSIMILFFVIAIILLERTKENIKYLYALCFMFALAFLDKSWHSGSLALVIIGYVILSGYIKILKVRDYFICFLCALGPVALWGIVRFLYDGTTFFEGMISYDLLSRTSQELESHGGDWYYYFEGLLEMFCAPSLIVMASIGGIITYKSDESREKNREFIFILILAIVIPFAVFTAASTKLAWYTYCAYPFLIILSAYGLNGLMNIIKNNKNSILVISSAVIICVQIFLGANDIYSNYVWVKNAADEICIDTAINEMSDYLCGEGKNIYVQTVSGGDSWGQSGLLGVLLYTDCVAVNGGVADWKSDKGAYIIFNGVVELLPLGEFSIVDTFDEFYLILSN